MPVGPSRSVVAGGLGGGDTTSDDVFLYDWGGDTWEKFASLFEARHSHMCHAEVGKGGNGNARMVC